MNCVVSTYTGLNRQSLPELLHALADAGREYVEILAAPPHVDLENVGSAVSALAPVLRCTGLRVTSVVPSGVDVNLASTHQGMRELSEAHFVATVQLAAALGADVAIVHPGRRHPLRPPPLMELEALVLQGLETVISVAEREGVQVLLENVPTGLLDTAHECAAVVQQLDRRLGLCFDVANGFMVEDVPRAILGLGDELRLVHVSDARRAQWLHDPLGSGDVCWPEIAAALAARSYSGRLVLETLHDGDPVAGFADDEAFWEAAVDRATQ